MSVPILIALCLNFVGLTLFASTNATTGTPICCLIFTLGIAGVLAVVTKCYANLLCQPAQGLLEFLFALYILEFVQHSFWYPLERSTLSIIEKWTGDCTNYCSDYENETICQLAEVLEYMQKSCLPAMLVCIVGTVISASFLHIVKIIDVQVLFTCGIGAFLRAIKLPSQDMCCACPECVPK